MLVYAIIYRLSKLHFKHMLRLFSSDPEVIQGRKDHVDEKYDEISFNEPKRFFYKLLNTKKLFTNRIYLHNTDCEFYFALGFFINFLFKIIYVQTKKVRRNKGGRLIWLAERK